MEHIASAKTTRVPAQKFSLLRDVEEEEAADLGAFQREYEDDHSWEALQEDEFGRLRPLVCLLEPKCSSIVSARHAYACVAHLLLGRIEPVCLGAVQDYISPRTWLSHR